MLTMPRSRALPGGSDRCRQPTASRPRGTSFRQISRVEWNRLNFGVVARTHQRHGGRRNADGQLEVHDQDAGGDRRRHLGGDRLGPHPGGDRPPAPGPAGSAREPHALAARRCRGRRRRGRGGHEGPGVPSPGRVGLDGQRSVVRPRGAAGAHHGADGRGRDEGRVRRGRAPPDRARDRGVAGAHRPVRGRRDPGGAARRPPAGPPRPGDQPRPGGHLRGAREVRRRPHRAGQRRAHRPRHRPRRGDPPGRAGALATDQEQPGPDRRARRRQDRRRGGPGPAHRRRRRAGLA